MVVVGLLMDLFSILHPDPDSIDIRLQAYDMDSLTMLVEARAIHRRAGDTGPLRAAVARARPLEPTADETAILTKKLRRLKELSAPEIILHLFDAALDPSRYAKRSVAAGSLEPIEGDNFFAYLALRDRCELPRNGFHRWLLEPSWRGGTFPEDSVLHGESCPRHEATDVRSLPVNVILYGPRTWATESVLSTKRHRSTYSRYARSGGRRSSSKVDTGTSSA
jgi:hypothetical protein